MHVSQFLYVGCKTLVNLNKTSEVSISGRTLLYDSTSFGFCQFELKMFVIEK